MRGTLSGAVTGAPLVRSCWGNVSRETSQVHRALSLALAPSMTLTWSWTAVVTHVSNDSTRLSDQHYATVRRLWLQERDESCDRAPSLMWVRDGGGQSTSMKALTVLHTTFRVSTQFWCARKHTTNPGVEYLLIISLIQYIFIHVSLDVFIFNEHTRRL